MKTVFNNMQNNAVILTTLNGQLDTNGNICSVVKQNDWCLITEQGGVSHLMKTNRYNNLRARHRFVNNTGNDIRYKWSINIITQNGHQLRYDFGEVSLSAGATSFSISVPYKYSSLLAKTDVKRIMVAMMIV